MGIRADAGIAHKWPVVSADRLGPGLNGGRKRLDVAVRYQSGIDSPGPESLKAFLSFLAITTAGTSCLFITPLPY